MIKLLTLILLMLLPIPTEASVTTNDKQIQKYVEKTLSYFDRQGFSLTTDIVVNLVTRREYANVVGKKIAQNSDGCTIGTTVYVVRECSRKDFIVAHELTHQLQRQLFGASIYKHRWYCEGTADQIAEAITGRYVTRANWHLKEFTVDFRSYEQANWYVYKDANGNPDLAYMVTKGKELVGDVKCQ